MTFKVTLLGAVRVDGPTGVVERLRTRTAMALFAYFVLNRRAHPRDELVERFWPEDEYESARWSDALAVAQRHIALEAAPDTGATGTFNLSGTVRIDEVQR